MASRDQCPLITYRRNPFVIRMCRLNRSQYLDIWCRLIPSTADCLHCANCKSGQSCCLPGETGTIRWVINLCCLMDETEMDSMHMFIRRWHVSSCFLSILFGSNLFFLFSNCCCLSVCLFPQKEEEKIMNSTTFFYFALLPWWFRYRFLYVYTYDCCLSSLKPVYNNHICVKALLLAAYCLLSFEWERKVANSDLIDNL